MWSKVSVNKQTSKSAFRIKSKTSFANPMHACALYIKITVVGIPV